jgi:hypothetical protein
MRSLRIALATIGAAACLAALAIPKPGVFALLGAAGLLGVVLSAGSVAADALPLRRLPLACSTASLAASLLLGVAGRLLGLPPLLFGLALVSLQLVPSAARRIPRR